MSDLYRFSGFTSKANETIYAAVDLAGGMGHTYVGSEHLLLALLRQEGAAVCQHLLLRGVQPERIVQKLILTVGRGVPTRLSIEHLTPRCRKIIENAAEEGRRLGKTAGTEHLLLSLLKEKESYACRFLSELSVVPEQLYREIALNLLSGDDSTAKTKKGPAKARTEPSRCPNLEKYSRDLTRQAEEGSLDPVIGREEEVQRVLEILSRRTKNNPCLIGEAGVGKTAVIEGVAQAIAAGTVPPVMREKRVYSIDLTGMIAGTKFRGEFEERVRLCLQEVHDHGNIILFVDEIHTIMGAGAAEGAIDAANILKPQLARGEIQVIGATTLEEYRRYIEKDAALARRFAQVMIEEPSQEKTVQILKGLRGRYEKHHNLQISNEAIDAAVRLSVRYLPERYLPDKAIDLMDEAASSVKLQKCLVTSVQEPASSLLPGTVGERDVAQVLSRMIKIPVHQMLQDQNEKMMHLEEKLRENIVGQLAAVKAVSNAIRRSSCGINDPNRPLGSFLFLGPTGVGKTQLCRALAKALFDREEAMIRIDMSEYMEKHSISRLIGTPPGYIGYEEGGQLTEKVRRSPFSIVLFDEVEKAHPEVFHLLLQVLDEGRLTDSSGKTVDFKNCVIVMTSNLGARKMAQKLSFGFQKDNKDENLQKEIMGEVKSHFSPEFLGRIDEILFFHYLSKDELYAIGAEQLCRLQQRMKKVGVDLQMPPDMIDQLLDSETLILNEGARPIRQVIHKKLEDPLAQAFLVGKYCKGDSIFCEMAQELEIRKITAPSLQKNTVVV
ncbi:MAG: ATP-dependent Clp protease ATP-binding subunit [Oscillospiraceae bacterium]|nr:ATP-dependent Clp protease ATP-binding subunit [Oscillospiraceae bacterium]